MQLGILLAPTLSLQNLLIEFDRILNIEPDTLWLADRLLADDFSSLARYMGIPSKIPPIQFLDPFLSIMALSRSAPTGLQFGVAVTDMARRKPIDIARACHTINSFIEHPLNLGIGAGEAVNLLPFGYARSNRPVSFMLEHVRTLRRIMHKGVCGIHNGTEVTVGYSGIPCKIWIGGQRERMLGITAELAEGWIPAWKMSAQEYAQKSRTIDQLAVAGQRQPPAHAMFAMCLIHSGKQAIMDHFSSSTFLRTTLLQAPGDVWSKYGLAHPAGDDSRGFFDLMTTDLDPSSVFHAIESAPTSMLTDVMFIGSLDDILSELWEYHQIGVEQLVLMYPFSINGGSPFGLPDFLPQYHELCRQIKKW